MNRLQSSSFDAVLPGRIFLLRKHLRSPRLVPGTVSSALQTLTSVILLDNDIMHDMQGKKLRHKEKARERVNGGCGRA